MAPKKWQRSALVSNEGPKARWFTGPAEVWTEPVIMEWELTGESWTDEHAHDEFAYVLEGQLFVESGGVTVEANEGDMVCVPAGSIGRYYAPKHARLLGIYGPNPHGEPMKNARFEKLNH